MDVHKEAVSRLDKPDPIFWMVDMGDEPERVLPQHNPKWDAVFTSGESSRFSTLIVDNDGLYF